MHLTIELAQSEDLNAVVQKSLGVKLMSQGFETKSADALKNSSGQRQPKEIADISSIQQNLVEHFADIKDPRVERTKKHQLRNILVIAILAVIAGAQGWEDIENYGISKQQWLEEFLELPNGIPSDDTNRSGI